MHRFYIPPNEWNPAAPILGGAAAHHARNVLRLDAGGKVVLFNGQGRELTGEIVSIDGAHIHLRKLHEASTPPLPCRITLAQAIPKGKNMDLIVQKAVEIGAAEIAPLISDRTIVHLDDGARRRSNPTGTANSQIRVFVWPVDALVGKYSGLAAEKRHNHMLDR